MKYILIIILFMSVFYSCGTESENDNLPDLSGANKIKFSYKLDFDPSGKMNIKYVEISDLKTVSDIRKIINYEPFTYIYCISSGSMGFYKDSTLLADMVFNTSQDLMHISCNYKGRLVAIKLSEENARFLDSFRN
ncbi:MAG TPA: hypothetical protein PKD83_12850 [Ignavibacteria bacterium]|nr:hypothetical protein [Ignavibacteria bacterium]